MNYSRRKTLCTSDLRFLVSIFLVWCTFGVHAQVDTLTIVSYNLLNFPDGRNDCSNNTIVPNRADTLRKIMNYVKPDIFVACEIQHGAGADSVLTRSLNSNGTGNYAAAQFDILNQEAPLNNQLYYNTNKLTLHSQYVISTSPRNIDHYILYFNDPNLGVYYDTTFVEVYMCHLKAGSGSAEKATRAQQTQILMNYISQRPQDRHHFVCGDLNVYTSSESAYQNMVNGSYSLIDPINSPGNWNNNGTFAIIHTQSTRNGQNLDCGSQGGSDDRFDQILVSGNVMNGNDSLTYIQNSYLALGNDGSHYNQSLLQSLPNSLYPDSLIRALYYMSDHLPVVMKARVVYPTSNGLALYPIIQNPTCNGSFNGEATIVANDGQAPYTYLWDTNAGNQNTATATGLSAGSYCVQVTDDLGEVDNYCVYLSEPEGFEYSYFQVPDNGSCTGEAHLIFGGGTAPYSYSWNDPLSQTESSAYNLCAGFYDVTVQDATGCTEIITVFISGVTGLDELSENDFLIHPNPANSILNITFSHTFDKSIELIDLQGRTTLKATNSKLSTQFDLSGLDKGSYFVRVSTKTMSSTKRVVVY